jgi:hypothetical protein
VKSAGKKTGRMLSLSLMIKVELMNQHLQICQLVVNSLAGGVKGCGISAGSGRRPRFAYAEDADDQPAGL